MICVICDVVCGAVVFGCVMSVGLWLGVCVIYIVPFVMCCLCGVICVMRGVLFDLCVLWYACCVIPVQCVVPVWQLMLHSW